MIGPTPPENPGMISRFRKAAVEMLLTKHESELIAADAKMTRQEEVSRKFKELTNVVATARASFTNNVEKRILDIQSTDLLDIVFTRLEPQYGSVLESVEEALPVLFVKQHGDAMIKAGRARFVTVFEDELAEFKKKNAADLGELGLI